MDNVAGQMNSRTIDKGEDGRHPFGAEAHLFGLSGWHPPQNRVRELTELPEKPAALPTNVVGPRKSMRQPAFASVPLMSASVTASIGGSIAVDVGVLRSSR